MDAPIYFGTIPIDVASLDIRSMQNSFRAMGGVSRDTRKLTSIGGRFYFKCIFLQSSRDFLKSMLLSPAAMLKRQHCRFSKEIIFSFEKWRQKKKKASNTM